MIIDISKRYRFLDMEYTFKHDYWHPVDINVGLLWSKIEFQHFADRGAVEEVIVRIPRRATVRIKFDEDGFLGSQAGMALRRALSVSTDSMAPFANAVFEGELVEVFDNE